MISRMLVAAVTVSVALAACGGGETRPDAASTAPDPALAESGAGTGGSDAGLEAGGAHTAFCQEIASEMQALEPHLAGMTEAGSALGNIDTSNPAAMQQGVQQAMSSLAAAAKPIADAFGRLAADAPADVKADFEAVASGMSALASGDSAQFAAAGARVQTSMENVSGYITGSCQGTDVSGLSELAGVGSGSAP